MTVPILELRTTINGEPSDDLLLVLDGGDCDPFFDAILPTDWDGWEDAESEMPCDDALTETESLLDYSHAALREMPDESALLESRDGLEARLQELREKAIAEAYRGDC